MANGEVGRPAWELTAEVLEKVESLAARGMTDAQIAVSVHLHPSTFSEKKSENPELGEAIKRGKDKGVAMMANVVFEKGVKGNTACAIFFLKARGGWSEREAGEAPGSVTTNNVAVFLGQQDQGVRGALLGALERALQAGAAPAPRPRAPKLR